MPSILDTYKERVRVSRNFCTPHWDRAIDNYKHYLSRLDVGGASEQDYPFQSKMVVPISYEIVETVLPRIIGKDPEFTAVAVEPEDVPYENTAKLAIEMAYNNPKLELMGEPIYLKLLKATKEFLVTGNMVLRPYWRRERSKQIRYLASLDRAGIKNQPIAKVIEAATELKALDEITYSKKLIDSPFLDDFDCRLVPFFQFLPDPTMSETGRMRYKIEEDWMTFEELADEAQIFGYDKATMQELYRLKENNSAGFTPSINGDFLQRYNDLFANPQQEQQSFDDKKIPLYMVHKMWMGDKVHVFVNEKYNLTGDTGMDNPYDVKKDPFVFGTDIVMPHSYFSRGEVDAIRKIEDAASDVYNMRFDNLVQAMLNFWLVNKNFMAEGDEFVPVPNTITSVTDIDRAVKLISGKDVTANAYNEANDLIQLANRVSGSNDYVKGNEGETLAGRTYGGLRLVQEAANARFLVKARLFEKMTLKSLGYFMLEMSRQFVNKDRVSRMIGEFGDAEAKTLKAGDLKSIKGFMDIKVIPNSSQQVDAQAEAIKLNSVADRMTSGKGPFAIIPPEVNEKFLLKYWNAYGITDAVYWVRAVRDARLKMEKETKKKPAEVPPHEHPLPAEVPPVVPGLNPSVPGVNPPLMPTSPTLQSDQVSAQPNPLAQIIQSEQLPPMVPQQ